MHPRRIGRCASGCGFLYSELAQWRRRQLSTAGCPPGLSRSSRSRFVTFSLSSNSGGRASSAPSRAPPPPYRAFGGSRGAAPPRGRVAVRPMTPNAAQPQSPRRACGAAGVAALIPRVGSTPTRRRPRLRRDAAGGCAGRSVVPRWIGRRRRLCLSLGDSARFSSAINTITFCFKSNLSIEVQLTVREVVQNRAVALPLGGNQGNIRSLRSCSETPSSRTKENRRGGQCLLARAAKATTTP